MSSVGVDEGEVADEDGDALAEAAGLAAPAAGLVAVGEVEVARAVCRGARPSRPSRRRGSRAKAWSSSNAAPASTRRSSADRRGRRRRRRSPSGRTPGAGAWPAPAARPASGVEQLGHVGIDGGPAGALTLGELSQARFDTLGDGGEDAQDVGGRAAGRGASHGWHRGDGHDQARLPGGREAPVQFPAAHAPALTARSARRRRDTIARLCSSVGAPSSQLSGWGAGGGVRW